MAEKVVGARVEARGTEDVEAKLKRIRAIQADLLRANTAATATQSRATQAAVEMTRQSERGTKAIQGLSRSTSVLAGQLGTLIPAAGRFGGAVQQASAVTNAAANALGTWAERGDEIKAVLGALDGKLKGMGSSLANVGIGAAALGTTFLVMKTVVEPLMQEINDITGLARKLNEEFERGEVAVRAKERALASMGIWYGTAREAIVALQKEAARVRDLEYELTEGVRLAGREMERQEATLVSLGANFSSMSDMELTKYIKEAGRAVSEDLIVRLERAKKLAPEAADAVGKLTRAFELQADEAKTLRDAEKSLLSELGKLPKDAKLSAKGLADLIDRVVPLQDEASKLGTTLDTELSERLKQLGVNADSAYGSMEQLKDNISDEAWAKSLGFEWGIGPKQGKAIHDEWLANLEKQKEAWRKADEEFAAAQKKSADEVAAHMEERYGEAGKNIAMTWSTHFANMQAELFGSMQPLWRAAAESVMGGSTAHGEQKSGAQNFLSGLGLGGDEGSGELSMSEKLAVLEKRESQKRGELAALGRVLDPNKGFNKHHLDKRADEIYELDRAGREARGERLTVADKMRDRWAERSDTERKTYADRKLDEIADKLDKQTNEIAKGAKEASSFASRQLKKADESIGLMREGNQTQAMALKMSEARAIGNRVQDANAQSGFVRSAYGGASGFRR